MVYHILCTHMYAQLVRAMHYGHTENVHYKVNVR